MRSAESSAMRCEELVTVAVMELERGGEDHDVAPRLEQRTPIAEVQVVWLDDVLLALLEEMDVEQAVAHGLAVGAGVADDRAAHRPRDVGGEREAGEPLPGDVGDQGGQFNAGLRAQDVAVQRGALVPGQHCEAGHAGIADEDVGAAPEHSDGQAELARREYGVDEDAGRPGAHQELGRAADSVRREGGEWDGLFEAGQLAPQRLAHARVGGLIGGRSHARHGNRRHRLSCPAGATAYLWRLGEQPSSGV